VKNVLLAALRRRQEVAAVRAEDQGTDCGHFAVFGACGASPREILLSEAQNSTAAGIFQDIGQKL
jgi:hypothetical protein